EFGEVMALPQPPLDSKKVQRWANVSFPEAQDGKLVIDILYSSERSLVVETIELHNNSTQTFIPLDNQSFLVMVGNKQIVNEAGECNIKEMSVFISNGHQGITLKNNIWHCSPLPVGGPIAFALIHRSPDVDLNIQLNKLKEGVILAIE
ncbi:MAG: ureidoglycolate lyase, partial [Candidatus Staskawiczbacteria bacterium]|nr:ureidoglycolate lyase [Candidatus Staskawiczbacteria bacterium]